MKYLLDTHIWLWSLTAPKRLGPKTARLLRQVDRIDRELWLSPLSNWEAIRLIDAGRLRVRGGSSAWVRTALQASPLREAPFTHEVAAATRAVELPQRDPVDRMLAATARVYELTLITADEQLRTGSGYAVIGND